MAPQKNPYFSGMRYVHRLYSLALIWFYTFIANKKQDIEKVYRYLGEGFKEYVSDGRYGTKNFFVKPIQQPFLPENIYWNPEGKGVSEQWHPLWQETLGLGLSLVEASVDENSRWSKHEFINRVKALADEIKQALFHDTYVEPKGAENAGSADVHEILLKIKEKWQQAPEASSEHLEETIVAPLAELMRPNQTIISRQDEALMERTGLDSPHHLEEESRLPIETNESDIPETIIAQPFGITDEASSSSTPLSSKNMHFQGRGHVSEEAIEGDTQKRKAPLEPEEDDFFTRTVILTPNKDKK